MTLRPLNNKKVAKRLKELEFYPVRHLVNSNLLDVLD